MAICPFGREELQLGRRECVADVGRSEEILGYHSCRRESTELMEVDMYIMGLFRAPASGKRENSVTFGRCKVVSEKHFSSWRQY
jgi:hypothetical protein